MKSKVLAVVIGVALLGLSRCSNPHDSTKCAERPSDDQILATLKSLSPDPHITDWEIRGVTAGCNEKTVFYYQIVRPDGGNPYNNQQAVELFYTDNGKWFIRVLGQIGTIYEVRQSQ